MAKVEFVLNSVPTIIDCGLDDTMISICQKFADRINRKFTDIFFLYNGGPIDLQAALKDQANKVDIENKYVKILAQALTDSSLPAEKILTKSKDIICK